ncbi:5-deoxy-glucuronate isomerase [Thermosporothrix hazakensis]|jgi:5-deoxy-glucuronate isomerase|uniref:5-deoxy-glucuronate isomerase n=1 Tax=Thermosporothrix hazakensis TaxID=644383 RepID=A0A326U5R3_THEHA|nr:5-deoxy-glucuronate isomerase [Thermosporothrix hazakensis]PZW29281.1 5-deoxy-glucuronate isomerase [Thermosporothrix hazakensis]GCE45366.1 5-deoxy-glucuronate isomerase [Thermosporothrix hazakensis]
MRQYDASQLIIHPVQRTNSGAEALVEVTPELAGWRYVSFQVRRVAAQEAFSAQTGESEVALVLLGGTATIETSRGTWRDIGKRKHVFEGLPYALYLPRHTAYTVQGVTECELAIASAPTEQDHEPRLVTPHDVVVEIRGGDHATRHINNIIPPGFPCQRLVVVEVYTPGGNWSSYPPHKHDIHRTDAQGRVIEADLEEIYYYQFDRPEGFAFQRIYTDAESPLHRAGYPIDAALLPRHNDVVLVPEGYHPVASPPGYTTYYLNVLAGSAQSLANSEDPAYAWVKETYQTQDARVPLYPIEQK